MLELLVAIFTLFMMPLPWIISTIHILIRKKKWNASSKLILVFISILVWAILGYLIFNNYQFLFANRFNGFLYKIIGILALLTAATIEILTTKMLGLKRVFGSSELKQTKDKLVTTGIYKYARHPRYIEHPFWFLGLGLLLGHTFLLWFSFYLFIAFVITAYFEELELIKRYGKKYLEYKKKVPAFFIFGKSEKYIN